MDKNIYREGEGIVCKLYCIPSLKRLEDFVAFSKEYQAGFEYNDFFVPALLDDEIAKERAMQAYLSAGRDCSQDTMHGVFLDVCVNSTDPKIFEVSDYRIRQCMDIAKRMGLKAVIFHTNYIVNFLLQSYIDTWLQRNEEYWRKILEEYPDQMIYIENMFDEAPILLRQLARNMEDQERFGVCLDVAHAFISGSPIEPWFTALKPYIKHVHLNDNDGREDLHLPVGSGSFDWEEFNQWGRSIEKKPSFLIEVRTFEDLQRSVQYMEEHKIFPFI